MRVTPVVLLFLAFFSLPTWSHQGCQDDLLPRSISPEESAFNTNLVHAGLKAMATGPSEQLKMATWNVNLLNVRGWKSHSYKFNSSRFADLLASYLSNEQPVVLMLQEVWSATDRGAVRSIGESLGYQVIDQPPRAGRHGLMTLIRTSAVARVEESGFTEYSKLSRVIFEMVGSVRRGLQWSRVRLKNGHVIVVGNTHFTAYNRYSKVRSRQVVDLKHALENLKAGADHALIGGDLNIAADFLPRPELKRHNQMLADTRWLYDYFAVETGLRDVYRSVNKDDAGYTYNFLYIFEANPSYTGTDRRLDYLWVGELAEKVRGHVIDAQIFFKEKIDGIYPSDHYLVQATVEFFELPQ